MFISYSIIGIFEEEKCKSKNVINVRTVELIKIIIKRTF